MNIDERTYKIELYIYKWINGRYVDWCRFYHETIKSKREPYGIYSLKDGYKLMDTLDDIMGNIEDAFSTEDGCLVPERFPSVDFLVQSLNRFTEIVRPSEKILLNYIKDKEGEDINPIASKMLQMISDIKVMAKVCTGILGKKDTKQAKTYSHIIDALLSENLEDFISIVQSLIESIPYDVHKEKMNEGYFHTLFHIILALVGFEPISEEATANGRIDVSLSLPELIYIFEFKYSDDGTDRSIEAIQQIKGKGYAKAKEYLGKRIIGVGVSFSAAKEQRNINGMKVEVLYNPS